MEVTLVRWENIKGIYLTSFMLKFVADKKLELQFMKRLLAGICALTGVLLVTSMSGIPEASEGGSVKWMTFEEALQKSKKEKRPVFIDVYTDWCGWCKVMDKNTFNDPQVSKLLNEKFYAVKFNAEQTEDVVFQGTTFKFV